MSNPSERAFEHVTSGGRNLQGVIHLPPQSGPRPTILICHGFKGFMDWGFFPFLADLLAARGFVAVRFNFSGSGVGPGEDRVSDLEAFRTATFSKDVEEIVDLLAALPKLAPGRIDDSRLGVFGHSRGGGTAIIATNRLMGGAAPRPKALVTWAAVSTFDYLGAKERDAWRREGSIEITNARTGQTLPIGIEVLEDLETHRDALDPTAAARGLGSSVRWLIVHGARDETVAVESARRLHEAAGSRPELRIVPDGNHTFGATHPFAGPTPALVEAMNHTQSWFRRQLA